jgi:chemotaxis-related protein WspD
VTVLPSFNGELPVLDDCWNRIGVRGDHSCPELAAVIHCHNCAVFSRAGQRLFERPPPPECVEEWTERLAQTEREPPGDVEAHLVFRVGAEWLGLDARALIEVAEPRRVHRVPLCRARGLLGIVNIRGELHLCLSLSAVLDVPSDPAEAKNDGITGWLLVAEHEGRHWALAVDEVAGVQRVPAVEIGPPPATISGSLTSAVRGVFLGQLGRKQTTAPRVGCLNAERLFALVGRCLE